MYLSCKVREKIQKDSLNNKRVVVRIVSLFPPPKYISKTNKLVSELGEIKEGSTMAKKKKKKRIYEL